MRSMKGIWRAHISIVACLVFTNVALGEDLSPGLSTFVDPSKTTAQPTCESRTVNYITHTLPQQCLTSSPEAISAAITTISTTDAGYGPTIPSATGPTSSENVAGSPALADDDGADLSTGGFMSFEEWKAMMLSKADKEALDGPRNRRPQTGESELAGDLDAIGEDGEINLDFDAYSDKITEITSSGKLAQRGRDEAAQKSSDVALPPTDLGQGHTYRNKDAGKTCKERFSYASFDAGATVLKTSSNAKNSKAILVENKDSYMLMECAQENKFFIVELSDDVLIDTVVLASFEFFSSMIRKFRVSVSDRYPVKLDKWKILGEFQARNSRAIQAFLVENPQIWARYIRIEFLSHYGNEYYCPISLFRVHGTRMLDSLKEADPNDLESDDGEDAEKAASEIAEEATISEAGPAISEPPRASEQDSDANDSYDCTEPLPYWDPEYLQHAFTNPESCHISEAAEQIPMDREDESKVEETSGTNSPSIFTSEKTTTTGIPASTSEAPKTTPVEKTTSTASSESTESTTSPVAINSNETSLPSNWTTAPEVASKTETANESSQHLPSASRASIDSSAIVSTTMANPQSRTAVTSLKPPTRSPSQPKSVSGSPASLAPRNKTATTTTSSAAPSPTVQDSFFKQITKRLQTLESNTTLSLQYIEMQSKFLQEALAKLERRQLAKVDLFLETLNKTVLSELRDVRTQYDQLWQSTVIALETHQKHSEREMVALGSRLSVLADEVVYQKRMVIGQAVLIILCMTVVIFSRTMSVSGMEMPAYPIQRRLTTPFLPGTPKRQREQSPGMGLDGGVRGHSESSDVESPPEVVVQSGTPSPTDNEGYTAQLHTANGAIRKRALSDSRPVPETTSPEIHQAPTPESMIARYDSDTETEGRLGPEKQPVPCIHLEETAEAAGSTGLDDTSEHTVFRTARPPMSQVGSERKPLPALPEDSSD